MRHLLTVLVVVLTTCQLGATAYFVDFVGGSDANNGLAQGTALKRCPGMRSYAGSVVPAAGDTFTLKGGVSWTGCFRWNVSVGGTAGNPVIYKSDVTWFAGGSFVKPLLDYQHTIISSGGYTDGAGTYVTASNVTFDGLEWANYRCSRQSPTFSNWGSMSVTCDNVDNITLANCTIRDWDVTSGPTSPGYEWNGSGGFQKVNGGSNITATNCLFHLDNTPAMAAGTAVWNVVNVRNCTFRNLPTAVMYPNLVDGNLIHDITNPTDPLAHSNCILAPGPVVIRNNLVYNVGDRATLIFIDAGFFGGPSSAQVYNNTVYSGVQPCVAIDTDRAGSVTEASYLNSANYVYNNTFVGASGSGPCIRTIYRSSFPEPVPVLNYRNNHLISSGAVAINNISAGNANVTTLTEGNNLTNTLAIANALGYTTANAFAPLDATKPTYNTGVDLSAVFTTDRLGTARPQAAVWDIGAYEFVTPGASAGTLVLSASSATIAETAGTITITAKRTSGSTGIVGCNVATANSTATSGINYTAVSTSFSWANGDTADQTVVIPILNVPFYGSKSFTVTISAPAGGAVLGTPATETVTINGVGSAPIVLLSGLSWPAPSDLAAPFASAGTYYSQTIQTTDPTSAGIANYYFTNAAGTYNAYVTAYAPSDAENSLYFAGLGTTPLESANVFDITASATTNEVAIRQRGPTGTPDFAETNAVQLVLDAGVTNQLQILGREPNVQVHNVRIELVTTPPPVDPPMILSTVLTNIDGYYKASSNLVVLIPFSTNVTVTGTPKLTLNSGGTLTNTAGSGTATLRFEGVIQPGENSQALDYATNTSLTLDGGTIRFGAVDAVLTLPTPAAPGSLSYGRSVIVDTLAPTTLISGPNSAIAAPSNDRYYTVSWTDANFAANTLAGGDITLNATGTAAATLGISTNNPFTSQSVTVAGITGSGTLSISVAAGTASDLAGNLAPAAGPSNPINVFSLSTLSVISTRANVVISK